MTFESLLKPEEILLCASEWHSCTSLLGCIANLTPSPNIHTLTIQSHHQFPTTPADTSAEPIPSQEYGLNLRLDQDRKANKFLEARLLFVCLWIKTLLILACVAFTQDVSTKHLENVVCRQTRTFVQSSG